MFVASRYATQILSGSNVVATRYATHKRSSSNVDKLHPYWVEFVYYIGGVFIENGNFYFINNQYFLVFPDPMLMKNKEPIDGYTNGRPCFYAFKDQTTGLYWMIPFSSQVKKYRNYYNSKIQKYGKCDTILFGHILGHEKAFLIQNMCPITPNYIENTYIDKKSKLPVRIEGSLEKELIKKAKHILALHRKGIKIIFPDILSIEEKLLNK